MGRGTRALPGRGPSSPGSSSRDVFSLRFFFFLVRRGFFSSDSFFFPFEKEAADDEKQILSLSFAPRLAHPLSTGTLALSLSTARSAMSGALASRSVAAAQRAAAPAVAPAKSSKSSHRRRRRQLLPMLLPSTTRSMLASPRQLAPLSSRITKQSGAVSALPFDEDDDDDDLTPEDVLGERSTKLTEVFFFGADERG